MNDDSREATDCLPLGRCSVCVGVITRNRPRLLARLLESLAALQIPAELDVAFAIVENATAASLDGVVSAFRRQVAPRRVIYEIQPQLGIPAARNKVLEIVHRQETQLLAFVDDDETVAADWLRAIVAEQQRRGLDLVGGPVRLQACDGDCSTIQRAVWQGLADAKGRSEARHRRAHEKNADAEVPVVTNNWLARREFLLQHSLCFDERLAFAGGSDTAFYYAAKHCGAKSGWAPGALVHEYVMPSRLTASYQLRRSIDQTMSSFQRKYAKRGWGLVAASLAVVLYKSLSAAVQLLAAPFDKGRSFFKSVRNIGHSIGRIYAMLGRSSQHYRSTHGF